MASVIDAAHAARAPADPAARRKISLLAIAMASRTRSAGGAERPRQPLQDDVPRRSPPRPRRRPARRCRRSRRRRRAPRRGAGRSSLLVRTRPGSRARRRAAAPAAVTVRSVSHGRAPAPARTAHASAAASAARNTKCSQYSVVIAVAPRLELDDERVGQLDARRAAAISCSAPGRSTPSGPFTAGGIATPSTDVPQLLASWMKKRPDASRRSRQCSRDTFDVGEHLHVHPDGAAAAADRQRVLAHAELVMCPARRRRSAWRARAGRARVTGAAAGDRRRDLDRRAAAARSRSPPTSRSASSRARRIRAAPAAAASSRCRARPA